MYLHTLHQNISPVRVSGSFANRFQPVDKKAKQQPINIGAIIDAKRRELRMSVKEVYTQMNMSRNNYYYHIDNSSIDTEMLQRFSEVLGVNFFLEFIDESEKGGKRAEILQRELDACKAELALTKEKLLSQYEDALKINKRA